MRPADIVARLIQDLSPLGILVAGKVPNPRPHRFIRVSVAGGGRANVVQGRPFVIVEAWADDSEDAADIASDAWARLDDLYGPHLSATMPGDFPDRESGQERYQFTAQPFIDLQ